ncbi:acyl-CoA dehydrogenase family protein [Tropicibacter naphthalenivorans]|uniref:Acyl-CoA dehydrogenase, short-chain specific n=1 Tax=Tropicibacter naphthalenivorans TaxID=441103 RepID=A0A0P1GGF3_9RHOB|nr:acyl-CoA dehydrogenase family protein [Tropicibacter naphthalenivorans]CUH80986.1 Acyl-CoA dehydrogenase, short-chain specific [Tropicibacter naphthalenivorans]SMC91622.1 Acyl-CoA dehydrogenase, C-terminal domain [Tropicibacter naphthalenivorans]
MSDEWKENTRLILESARAILPGDRSLDRVRKARFDGAGAAGADLFAVLTGRGVALVDRGAAGVTVDAPETLDGARLGAVSFDTVAAEFLPCANPDAVLDSATLAHAAYLLGLSDAALDITLDYLRIREQFGRPIGSFQSLQHRATEMKIQLELTRAAVEATARRFDTGADATARKHGAARCHLRAGTLAMHVSREAIQMHGAMGITDEADIGLYVRKAMTEANLFGAASVQRRVLSDRLNDPKQEHAA